MNEKLISKIDELSSNIVTMSNNISEKNIRKAGYDKTLIGYVSEKIERDDGTYRWCIQTNGTAYDIKPEMCNIQAVGQRVRLYIPNHSFKDKYAEIIDDIFCDENLIEVTKVSDNEVYAIYKSPVNPNVLYKQTIKAEGSGNTRKNFSDTIEVINI